ncbi:hypothetical protein D3C84_826430 [compost metagenome]
MIRPRAQAQAQVFVAIVLREHRAAFCVQGEWVSLLLLVGCGSLGGHIDQHTFQRCLGLPHFAQRQQCRLSAFNATFRRIHHSHLVGGEIETLLAVALVGVVYHQGTRLLQARPQHAFSNEFGNRHLSPRRLRMDITSLSIFSVRAVMAASFQSSRLAKSAFRYKPLR